MYTPDKLIDTRQPEYRNTPTVAELVRLATNIQSIPDEGVRLEQFDRLQAISEANVAGHTLSVQSNEHYTELPNGVYHETDSTSVDGTLLGFFAMRATGKPYFTSVPEADETASIVLGTALYLFSSNRKSTRHINKFFPLGSITSVASMQEFERLLVGEYKPGREATYKKLMDTLATVANPDGRQWFDATIDTIAESEAWDYTGNLITLHHMRQLPLDIFAGRSLVYSTQDDNSQPVFTEVSNLSFSGYFWATSAIQRLRNGKPFYVFELTDTQDESILETKDSDPRGKLPLVYVPVSDAVRLDIQLVDGIDQTHKK